MKTVSYKIPSQPKELPPFRINRLDGGLNLRDEQSNILDNQSPHSLNTTCDDRGALSKRPGQELLYLTSLGAGQVHLYTDYHKKDGTVKTLLHHGTKLYTQAGTAQPIEIATGLTNAEGVSFVFGDIFYYILPSGYLRYDGTTVSTVTPHIPTVLVNCDPATAGSGTVLDDYNFIGNKWNQKYSYTDAATTVFYLAQNADSVKVFIYGTEITTFTFDGVNKVTLALAPGAGTNHVMIQPTKAGLMDPNNILKCKYSASYGGENDTRIHITGNPDYPATVYRCSVMDPTYWPEQSSGAVGEDSDKNTGFLVYQTSLLLFKERSIQRDSFYLTDAGVAVFDWRPIHSTIGCNMPKSIQMVANYPVFCNTYKGAHIVVATSVREEKNVMPISGNINGAPYRPGLLDEDKADLLLTSSVDFDNKYWLNVSDKVYVWDYDLSPYRGDDGALAWFKWDNFNANVWFIRDRELYYGKRDKGEIVHIQQNTSIYGDEYHRLNDFGEAINGVWRSKLFHFGYPEWLKTIKEVYFRTREVTNTQLIVNMLDSDGLLVGSIPLISASFSWSRFSWMLFTWSVRNVPMPFKLRPKLKKTIYFQFEITNNEIDQDMPIMDLEIYFNTTKKVR